MDILFLITGFLFALIIPLLNLSFLGFKGFLYAFIMIIFAIVVLAYVILSIFKFQISKIDFLKNKVIVSWNAPTEEKKKSKAPYVLSLVCGLLLGILIYFKSFNLIISILASLACAFTVLGWWLMGINRLNKKLDETDTFLLSHLGMIFNGKVDVFNGYSKGITSASKKDNKLVLNILKHRKETEFVIDIPDNKINDVDEFLKDLKEFFDGDNDEKQ